MNKDWLAQNQNNVSGWSDISTPELLFYKNNMLSSMTKQYKNSA